ncbi:hypothetical protein BH11PLA2_BH11PLA2_28170 [soil metagenome]
MRIYFWSLLAVVSVAATSFGRPPTPVQAIDESTEVLSELETIKMKGIPPKLMDEAKAIAIIPNTVKVGFVFGGRVGHGLVMTKNDKGEWSDPTFITLGGASVGFQAGISSTDVVLVFKKKDTLEKVLAGKGKLTLGADAAVAAGPLGRQAAAATDGKLEAEIYSYSRSRGLFAGVSLDGAALMHDKDNTDMFKEDQRASTAKALVTLKNKLVEISKEAPAAPPPPAAPTAPPVRP